MIHSNFPSPVDRKDIVQPPAPSLSLGERVTTLIGMAAACYFVFWGCSGPISPPVAPMMSGPARTNLNGGSRARKHTMSVFAAGGTRVGFREQAEIDFEIQGEQESWEQHQQDGEHEEQPNPDDVARTYVDGLASGSFTHTIRADKGFEFSWMLFGGSTSWPGAGLAFGGYFSNENGDYAIAPTLRGGVAWGEAALPMSWRLGDSHALMLNCGVRYSIGGLWFPLHLGWRFHRPGRPVGLQLSAGGYYAFDPWDNDYFFGGQTHSLIFAVDLGPVFHF